MGIFDRFRRKKKESMDQPKFPAAAPSTRHIAPGVPVAPAVPTSATRDSLKAEVDLVLSQMENVRMQYEAISARLQNIERLVTEIRSFCK